jgi:hypothetical protein
MSSPTDLERDLRLLDHLEDHELSGLTWGLLDGGYREDEFDDLLDTIAEQEGDPRTVVDMRRSLAKHGLIFKARTDEGFLWRTRMAETVRLLVRLRQVLPKHIRDGNATAAPSLVSDFRFVARRRRFPRRTLSEADYVRTALSKCPADHRLTTALTGLAGASMAYSGFQARAAASILQNVDSPLSTVTLISSGTGSGKTKAFYLPALAKVATLVDKHSWTKLIAVYPRNELLKDQCLKTVREVRTLRASTGISLTVGAFYGDVPGAAADIEKKWKARGSRRICPFLACPSCEKEMYWDPGVAGGGGLRCTSCQEVVTGHEFLLTRDRLQQSPPDVLLVNSEMLNRHMSNDFSRHLFGLGKPATQRPRFLLLDEVHILTGSFGAHTGLVLRRWRRALGSPLHTVALSATIEEGPRFLSQLLDIPADRVAVIQPLDDELIDGGNEYLIALRSDPTSRTAVLSTTIQASMLLRRALDLPHQPSAKGAFGTKAFVFTDDLDVTNRLLHFLRSAEGQKDDGTPDLRRSPGGSLANLRNPVHHDDPSLARRDGQLWELPMEFGHTLDRNQTIRIERTSSQDPGLEKSADVVVATASLEVGLDDDSVGGVIQHKAPRDSAAFIQRRGRAGRQQVMRPWTAVVLSDYGRDRRTFQEWDQLFSPVLRADTLPIGNRHILRMQATFCLMDWLAERLRGSRARPGATWNNLSGTTESSERIRLLLDELDALLDSEARQRDLADFVSSSLGCEPAEADRLLWGSPRGVLSVVVPTVHRRLEAQWRSAIDPDGGDIRIDYNPLPDFVPTALFRPLLLPEVEIDLPEGVRLSREREALPFMGVQQALREFSPGRVTHRFAPGNKYERTWIDPAQGEVDVARFAETEPIDMIDDESGDRIPVLRPVRIKPVIPPLGVSSTSQSRPRWLARFDPVGVPVPLQTPEASSWASLITSIDACVHEAASYLMVLRATTGSDGTCQIGRDRQQIHSEYRFKGAPAALGFSLNADALRVHLVDPGNWEGALDADPSRARSLRAAWFRHLICSDKELVAAGSGFIAQWLAEVALAAIIEQSSETRDLATGVAEVTGPRGIDHLDRVMTVIFQSTAVTDDSSDLEDEIDVSTLHDDIRQLVSTPEVAQLLRKAGEQLCAPSGDAFLEWLRDRYTSTIAGALAVVASELHEEITVDDLVIDILPWVDGQSTIIISESQPGGIGIINRLVDEFQVDPRRVWRLLEHVIGESDDERLDRTLVNVNASAVEDDEIRAAFESLRSADTQAERRDAWLSAMATLEHRHGLLGQSARTAITLRMLRAGTSAELDELIHRVLDQWEMLETDLGVEVDVRVLAYLASADPSLGARLRIGSGDHTDSRWWRFSSLLSLLWARGGALRSRYLSIWTPYADLAEPDRKLVSDRLSVSGNRMRVPSPDEPATLSALTTLGEVEIAFSASTTLKSDLLRMLVEPVEMGVLEFFPRIVGVHEEEGVVIVQLEVPEVLS